MKKTICVISIVLAVLLLIAGSIWIYLETAQFGFSGALPEAEKKLRSDVVATAEKWLGTLEGSSAHASILEIYNTHEPLAQGYTVTPTDNWCATFGSTVAIQLELTDIIPTECGCQRQITLWQELGRWEESDNYYPQPGDYIYYAWDEKFSFGDCTGWADHVGIVVGTAGPFIRVIEGNKDDSVTYRTILRGDWQIRGYGLPDYASQTP